MSRSNNKKGSSSNRAAKSPVPKETEHDENAYSKLLESRDKRNELLKLRKEAKKANRGNGVAAGTTLHTTQDRSQSRARKSETTHYTCSSGVPDMIRGFFKEKDILGMSTEMKADGTMTHSFHMRVQRGDSDDEDSDSSDPESDDGVPPQCKMRRFSMSEEGGKSFMHSRRTIKIEGGSPDNGTLGEFLSSLSNVLKGNTPSSSSKLKYSSTDPRANLSSATSSPVKKPTPVAKQEPKVEVVKPNLITRSMQTVQMAATTEKCSKCARTAEHCTKAQRDAEEAQSQAKKFEEKAGRTDAVEKRLKELQKEAKKTAEEREKREKEVKKMEKNHANELRKKDREMEVFKSDNEAAAEKVANYQEAIKKANAKSAALEKQVESLKAEMKQVQTCMDGFAEVEVWLKTEKLKNLQLEEEIAELKRQERKSSPNAWGNPDAAKDAEELKELKLQNEERLKNERAQALRNSQLAKKLVESENRYKELLDERTRDDALINEKNKKITELFDKNFHLESEIINLKRDFQIRESANKVIGKEKNRIDELKLKNNDLQIRLHQQEGTIDALLKQLVKPYPSAESSLSNGLASLTMRTDIPPPPSRSTWSTLSTSSDSPPAQPYIPTPIQPPNKQQKPAIPSIPGWMKSTPLAPIGTKPATQSTQEEPTPEWMSAVVKNSDPDGDWVGAVLPDDDDIDVSIPPPPVTSLVQKFGGFHPWIPNTLADNKCFVCLWDIKQTQTTLECGVCQRKVHEQCGRKLVDSGEPCWGCEQRKKRYLNGTKA